jgi:hypothetical protein
MGCYNHLLARAGQSNVLLVGPVAKGEIELACSCRKQRRTSGII